MTQDEFDKWLASRSNSMKAANAVLLLPNQQPQAAAPRLRPVAENPDEPKTPLPDWAPTPDKLRASLQSLAVPEVEEKLNGTEKAYLAWARTLRPWWLGVQNITLLLARDLRYTPDFWIHDEQGLRAVDTKGTKVVDGKATYYCPVKNKNKIIVAAKLFPQFRFLIAYQHPRGVWNHVEISS